MSQELLVFSYGVISYSGLSRLISTPSVRRRSARRCSPCRHGATALKITHTRSRARIEHRPASTALVQASFRDATERFKDVRPAENEGRPHQLLFGCVSGRRTGAMGLHCVNLPLVFDGGELDRRVPARDHLYARAVPSGRLRITGADFLVREGLGRQASWQPAAAHGTAVPSVREPQSLRLPAFYTLHVWAWKESPTGTFVNWHSTCHVMASKAFTTVEEASGHGHHAPYGKGRSS